MRAKAFLLAAAVILLIPFAGNAATLVETFDAGISLQNWSVHRIDAAGSPWTVQAPDDRGGLRIAKAADSDAAMGASDVYGLIESRFVLHGDLSVQIDFDLLTFPLADAGGWNEAVVRLIGAETWTDFASLRFAGTAGQYAEGFSNRVWPYVTGEVVDSTSTGRLRVTRAGETMSAWIDRGGGPERLGSLTSSTFLEPMKVQIYVVQTPQSQVRPHTALDVRFDNFLATADAIVPEPASAVLVLLGGLALLRGRTK